MTIDWWTLGLQTVNVVILVWLLQHFFWRPIAAMIEQRRADSERIVTDAEATRVKAAAALAEIEKTRAGFAGERDKILAGARDDAERARKATADDAAKSAEAVMADAKTEIEKAKAEAGKAWDKRANDLAVDVAGRLAGRLDGAAVNSAFLDWLLAAIKTLPDPERLAAAANGAGLEAVSATALDPAEQTHYGELIGRAFGSQPRIAFKVDPTLIAGLELHGPHFTVGNSWRADLVRIRADISH